MGVPKFFRYISERYPCLSEVVKEYQLPEFDNLYLDMNGIIHMCSHPDDNNPHFRITEEKIFQDVFHYIEVLFRMIRPQKLFFMAVDGVAPRAKMNQQRGRRFRSAKEADKMEKQAEASGEKLPSVARFDSNCITPGTEFMCRLHEQLKYFVVNKISTDPLWKNCNVILSGHETPGEGEHKIMDYIRYMRAQPGYDPNTRHCLYGLDADLIMLGLCTHEPHFSLLREEVKFGKKSTKRLSVPEEITFFLLHLSLMREYLELEFKSLETHLEGFDYDFEKIIDDWVLMGFLVGNDFIPHLPNLHIEHGALPLLYKTYSAVLPELGGYINEGGKLNLERFQKFMDKLSSVDLESFDDLKDDIAYMESKTGRKFNMDSMSLRPDNLEKWQADAGDNFVAESLEPESCLLFGGDDKSEEISAKLENVNLNTTEDEVDEGGTVKHAIDIDVDESDDEDLFDMYKRNYYRNKMQNLNVTEEFMRDQAEGYVRAIQWNLNYYYNGCCSWSWYYPHHYAPYISDIKNFENMKIEFELGEPFKPFEQLLAVLPPASKNLLPAAYHDLMMDKNSVIKEYYPEEFQTDLNGKRQEWEAVVLVPFIDEKLLLDAMETCNSKLTEEEKSRNKHGPMLLYSYTKDVLEPYKAPQYFNTVAENHAKVQYITIDDIRVPIDKLIKGAYPGVKQNIYYPGFPTMKHLKYEGFLKKAKIHVFEQPSRNENMIIRIISEETETDSMPVDYIGKTIFVGWPHLVEAKLVGISNKERKYESVGGPGQYNVVEKTGDLEKNFEREASGITEFYKSRMGIECGETKILLHTRVMIGRRYIFTENGRISLSKEFAKFESSYPLQATVLNMRAYDSNNSTFRDVESLFPLGCECYTITNPYYGSKGTVLDSKETLKNGRLKISINVVNEPDFSEILEKHRNNIYVSGFKAAQKLSMSSHLFSKITGCVFLTARNNEGGLKNVNVGLDLKFNKKNQEVPGYTRKVNNTWLYSLKAVELVEKYADNFPEVLQFVSRDGQRNQIAAEEIFGEQWEEKIKEVTTFLKELPSQTTQRRTCGSQAFDKEVIEDLENIIDNFVKKQESKNIIIHVKPAFLYRPEVQSGTCLPDKTMQAEIMDRIVNVRVGFTVPYGLKGTIIAINEPQSGNERDIMYEIIFDEVFPGGLALNCSDGRGYSLPGTAFINITHGKRLMEAKTGKPNNFMQKPVPENNSFFGKNSAFAQFSQPAQDNPQMKPNFIFPHAVNNGANKKQPTIMHRSNNIQNSNNSKDRTVLRNEHKNEVSPNKILQRPTPSSNTKPNDAESNKKQTSNFANEIASMTFNNTQSLSQSKSSRVDTDMLKKMLKINNADQSSNLRPNAPSKSSENKINVSDIFANAPTAPASAQLLTYYQSNRLGCPKYQYMTEENGKVVAHLRLPSGRMVLGNVSTNREDASESVAEEALKIFFNKHITEPTTQPRNVFPIPPVDWVQPANKPKTSKDNAKKRNQDQHAKNYDMNNSTFVPMQAMKRNIANKTTHNNHAQKNSKENPSHPHQSTSNSKENQTTSNQSRKKTDNPKPRRTRIAANFSGK